MDTVYDEKFNYIEAHIMWSSMNVQYSKIQSEDYIQLLKDMYSQCGNGLEKTFDMNKFAYYQLINDKIQQRKMTDMMTKINELISNPKDYYAFITVGYNEQVITPQGMKNTANKIKQLKHFSSVIYVHEKHRENGIHHHTHFLCRLKDRLPKSKIIQYVFQACGKLVLKKEFIDVKTQKDAPYEVYEKYIKGEKTESKKQYLELDIIWRKANALG